MQWFQQPWLLLLPHMKQRCQIMLTTLPKTYKRYCHVKLNTPAKSPEVVSSSASVRAIGQPTPSHHPHLLQPGDITRHISKSEYERRRNSLMHDYVPEDSAIILNGHSTCIMSNDIPYTFRQNSNFSYLCGLHEPDTLMFLHPDANGNVRFIIFLRNRNAKREMWDGPMCGLDMAKEYFGADEAYPISSMDEILFQKLNQLRTDNVVKRIYCDFITSAGVKNILLHDKEWNVRELAPLIESMRLIKSPGELRLMREAAAQTSLAFIDTMSMSTPGCTEHQLSSRLEYVVRLHGATRLAYPPVVAGGDRALTLHYVQNDRVLRDGDLVLVDAGADNCNYACDITRVWPVNGTFSPGQRDLYDAVLRVQKKLISMLSIDQCTNLDILHRYSCTMLNEELLSLGIIKSKDSPVQRFYPHHVSHWLGMDTHDVSTVRRNTLLKPGMVVTVEPGLYIPNEPDIPERYRGIGIRIEDDVLITEDAPEVLTSACPKEIKEIESIVQTGKGKNILSNTIRLP